MLLQHGSSCTILCELFIVSIPQAVSAVATKIYNMFLVNVFVSIPQAVSAVATTYDIPHLLVPCWLGVSIPQAVSAVATKEIIYVHGGSYEFQYRKR